MDLTDPHRQHTYKLAIRRSEQAKHGQRDRWLSYARLLTVAVSLVLTWSALLQRSVSAWWLLIPAVVFVYLMRVHDRVIRSYKSTSRAVAWHEKGLARLEDRWVRAEESGNQFLDDDHPYAKDLDLFGKGSLFQLLNNTQTTSGANTLAKWLLQGSEPTTVRLRQEAVGDLAVRPDLLESLYALDIDACQAVDLTTLLRWSTGPHILRRASLRILVPVLSLGFVVSLIAWSIGIVIGLVPLCLLLVNVSVGLYLYRSTHRILHTSSAPARELVLLAEVMKRVRLNTYNADRLSYLVSQFDTDQNDPVKAIHRLDLLIQMHDWQHNMFFAPIAAVVLWQSLCAMAVERWRIRHGSDVEVWLQVIGEFEALASLGTYRFEHPKYPFPKVLTPENQDSFPIFCAKQLSHPLLPQKDVVANDVQLGSSPQLLVISGSNMSGKTTLLRTVGINTVLALAGAPVRATSLKVSPVVIGGTLRVHDSLLDGRSRFYAEILKVKQLVEMARGSVPLLFLMDELFHGTNSQDRADGAREVLTFLADLRAIGMVTTHDLALVEIGEQFGNKADNFHFQDRVLDGKLLFDYRLKPGRSSKGNALALMQAVGLTIESPKNMQQKSWKRNEDT